MVLAILFGKDRYVQINALRNADHSPNLIAAVAFPSGGKPYYGII